MNKHSLFRLTSNQITRHLLVKHALHADLLPELIAYVLCYTFAPYEVETILIANADTEDTARPHSLQLYYPLKEQLQMSSFHLTFSSLCIQISKEREGHVFVHVQTPHERLPIRSRVSNKAMLPINQLLVETIDCINVAYATSGVSITLHMIKV